MEGTIFEDGRIVDGEGGKAATGAGDVVIVGGFKKLLTERVRSMRYYVESHNLSCTSLRANGK